MNLTPLADLADRLPLLVTGATGVAGYNALHYFRRRYPGLVIGTRPRSQWRLTGDDVVAIDAEDRSGLDELFRTHRFRTILNCVGNCALKSCELAPAMARTLNVASAEAIVACVRRYGGRLVHLSSDLVFSGQGDGGYVETDPIDPVTVYGKTMAEAEEVIRAQAPETPMLRIALPMGRSLDGHAGAIDWIQSRFRKGRPATLYFDELRSATYCDDLSRVCERFLAGEEAGLFHAGGPRALALYQIGQIVNRCGGYDPVLLHGCPRHMAGPIPPRAGNVSMNSRKLIAALGHNPFRPWPIGDDLVPNAHDWHFRREPEEGGSIQRIEARLYHYSEDARAAFVTPCAGKMKPIGHGSC